MNENKSCSVTSQIEQSLQAQRDQIARGPVAPGRIDEIKKLNRIPAWRRASFPAHEDRPLYDFMIRDGRLVRTAHLYYQEYTARRGTGYRIYAPSGIKTKEPGQLDRVLNNHVWTFDPDPSQALALFRIRAKNELVAAQTALASARDQLDELDLVAKNLNENGLSGH